MELDHTELLLIGGVPRRVDAALPTESKVENAGKRGFPPEVPWNCKKFKSSPSECENEEDDEEDITLGITEGNEECQSVTASNNIHDDGLDGKAFGALLLQEERSLLHEINHFQEEMSCTSKISGKGFRGEESLKHEHSLSNRPNKEEKNFDECQKPSTSENVHSFSQYSLSLSSEDKTENFNGEKYNGMVVAPPTTWTPETLYYNKFSDNVSMTRKNPRMQKCKQKNASDETKKKLKKMIQRKWQPPEPPKKAKPNIPNFDFMNSE